MPDGAAPATLDLTQFDGCRTVPELFANRCKKHSKQTAHREKDLGIWKSYTWDEYWNHAQWIGLALAKLGVERGQVVSILSEDRREWLYADMAIVAMGGITNGVYTTDSAAQLKYLVNDSGTIVLFLENDEQLDKWLEVRDEMPTLTKVVVLDRDGLRDFSDPMVMFFDDLIAMGQQAVREDPQRFEAEIAKASPDDIAMLVYTSGTTGPPKGAMISHSNMIFQMAAAMPALEVFENDEQLCFLPLCHVLERLVSTYAQLASGVTVNFSESAETVFENLQEVSPHTFVAVPRVWEKIYSRIQITRAEATPIGRWALDQAIKTGMAKQQLEEAGKPVPSALLTRYRIWEALVLKNLRRMLGMDRIRRGGTGAAPISPDLLRWFAAIGVPVLEGYGATETSGIATFNQRDENNYGTVGMPVPGTDVKISPEGEILVQGGHVFQGYWNKPEKTAETIRDGWLHTGDVGRIGNDGALTITGRIKDIIITAGGKNITPAEIESRLKFSPFISDAVIIGDGRKFLSCLVMIDQENVEKYAQDRAVPFSDFASLCAATEVQELVKTEIDAVNKEFARVEQIKDFRLIDILLTAEDDELTPTMKLKRSFVEQKHKALIDSMYAA
ncbi:MAG: long-chain fatty acid--CoA ligase [Paracoccaceae bacterium]